MKLEIEKKQKSFYFWELPEWPVNLQHFYAVQKRYSKSFTIFLVKFGHILNNNDITEWSCPPKDISNSCIWKDLWRTRLASSLVENIFQTLRLHSNATLDKETIDCPVRNVFQRFVVHRGRFCFYKVRWKCFFISDNPVQIFKDDKE